MMRAPSSFAVVVRRKDGSLHVRERHITDERKGWRRLPLVRGVASLVESLRLGSEALRFSAEQMTADYGVGTVLSALGLWLFTLATTDASGPPPGSESRSSSCSSWRSCS
jgi:hypothetical protein